MKQVEKIWAELSAKPQKVELAAKDMYNTSKALEKAVSQMEFSSQLFAMKKGIENALDGSNKLMNELEADMKDFESKAKELGMFPDSSDMYVVVKKTYDAAKNDINKGQRLLDAIKKLG